jgi:hypothetical protein
VRLEELHKHLKGTEERVLAVLLDEEIESPLVQVVTRNAVEEREDVLRKEANSGMWKERWSTTAKGRPVARLRDPCIRKGCCHLDKFEDIWVLKIGEKLETEKEEVWVTEVVRTGRAAHVQDQNRSLSQNH